MKRGGGEFRNLDTKMKYAGRIRVLFFLDWRKGGLGLEHRQSLDFIVFQFVSQLGERRHRENGEGNSNQATRRVLAYPE